MFMFTSIAIVKDGPNTSSTRIGVLPINKKTIVTIVFFFISTSLNDEKNSTTYLKPFKCKILP